MEPFALHFSRCSLSFICCRANQRLIRSNCSYRCFKVPLQPHKTCFDPLNKTIFCTCASFSSVSPIIWNCVQIKVVSSCYCGADGPAHTVSALTLIHDGGLFYTHFHLDLEKSPNFGYFQYLRWPVSPLPPGSFFPLSPFYNLSHHVTPTVPNMVHHQ